VVEDDAALATAFACAFERRGWEVRTCTSPAELDRLLAGFRPTHALVDLKLGTESGLPCIARLAAADPDTLIVVLTGYASIATAVEAVKLGAAHYLPKPVNLDDLETAFARGRAPDAGVAIDGRPTSLKTLEWERINEVLADTGYNISETARRLGMHRRTLARKLAKRRVS
jgi:two-component system response regulator RegA